MEYRELFYPSPIGELRLVSCGSFLAAAAFPDGRYQPDWDRLNLVRDSCPVLEESAVWLDRYFSGENPGACPPLSPLDQAATPFRRVIWSLLQDIPYGTVTSYGVLAEKASLRLGVSRMSAQAVGGAVGHNPIAIFIPCHRVVGRDGSLTGYAGGLSRKQFLLNLEKSSVK